VRYVLNPPNRTMSKADFEVPAFRAAADAVQETQRLIKAEGLVYSHWCGQLDDAHIPSTVANKGEAYEPLPWSTDDERIPWFTLWEYSWVLSHSGLLDSNKKLRVLSLGGSSSSCEATVARMGHHVTVIEGRPYTADNARKNARHFGWDMLVHHGRFEDLPAILRGAEPFDVVISTNVLFLCGDEARRVIGDHLFEFVRPGGEAFITFDFGNPNPKRYLDDPYSYFGYSYFEVQAHEVPFLDNGERHHFFYPDPSKGHYTAGAVALRRAR